MKELILQDVKKQLDQLRKKMDADKKANDLRIKKLEENMREL